VTLCGSTKFETGVEAWCYKYLGYTKRDPVHVTKVADLVETGNQKGRVHLCICDHHFEDCFVRCEQPNLKISMVHRDDICTAGRGYRQDGSHAKEAWPGPSAKRATIFDVVRSRWGLASKSAVRTTTLVPVSRDVSTIDAEPIQTPTAPAIGGRATSPLVLFPNLTYLATHEKRGFESIMAPNGPLDS
jgi:hypothetical protein